MGKSIPELLLLCSCCSKYIVIEIHFVSGEMRSQYSEMFLMLSIMVWSTLGVGGKPLCDPEENKYYHHQAGTCLQCERCLKGEEVISVEVQ